MVDLTRKVRRKSTGNGVNRRRYVITLFPGDVIGFRDERTRKTFTTTLARCYALAVKEHVALERAARKRS